MKKNLYPDPRNTDYHRRIVQMSHQSGRKLMRIIRSLVIALMIGLPVTSIPTARAQSLPADSGVMIGQAHH